jgi:hypothetical protein
MANNLYTNIIGIGPLFPIRITENEKGEKGWYPVNGDIELVHNNLSALLWYDIGQRFRQEDFGTRLWECIQKEGYKEIHDGGWVDGDGDGKANDKGLDADGTLFALLDNGRGTLVKIR